MFRLHKYQLGQTLDRENGSMDNTFEWREEEQNRELQGTIVKKGDGSNTMSAQAVTPIGNKTDSLFH